MNLTHLSVVLVSLALVACAEPTVKGVGTSHPGAASVDLAPRVMDIGLALEAMHVPPAGVRPATTPTLKESMQNAPTSPARKSRRTRSTSHSSREGASS